MKKIYGFLGVAALLSLASCSSDNVDAPNGGQVENGKGEAYIEVQLKLVGTGTRADALADNGYKYGTDNENAVKKVTLGFYDDNNRLIQLAQGTPTKVTTSGDGSNVAQTYGVYKVEVSGTTKENAKRLVAYVNCEAPTGNLDLSTVQSSLGDDSNGYVMTSSTYFIEDEGKLIYYTPITGTNFYTDPESKGEGYQAVAIYVERLAAKVEFKGVNTINDVTVYDKNGKEGKLTFTPTNWFVQNVTSDEYLIKKLGSYDSEGIDGWANKETAFRNYWSVTPYYSGDNYGLTAKTVTQGVGEGLTLSNNVPASGKSIQYIYENTFEASRLTGETGNPWEVITSVALLGNYTASAVDESGFDLNLGDNVTTFYLRGGYINLDGETQKVTFAYNEVDLVSQLLSEAQVTAVNSEAGITGNDLAALFNVSLDESADEANAVKIVIDEEAEGLSEVKFSIKGVEQSDNAITEVNNAIATYLKLTPALKYNGGQAYYVIPLRLHFSNGDTATYKDLAEVETGDYGIVRNTWYELTVNSITNLATGVGDPDEDEPQHPEDPETYYIDAVLNVLEWHGVQQSVDL